MSLATAHLPLTPRLSLTLPSPLTAAKGACTPEPAATGPYSVWHITSPRRPHCRFQPPCDPLSSRLVAANVVTSPIIAFLDAHLEVSPGWLEPLLYRLATRGRNMVVMPMVDILNRATQTLTPASAIMR